MRQIKSISIFRRGVYLAENTSQAASVEFVRLGGQIMRAADCKHLSENPKGFSDSLNAALKGGVLDYFRMALWNTFLSLIHI